MDARGFTRRRITSAVNQRRLSGGLLLIGAVMVILGWGQYQRVTIVGLLYGLLAAGALLGERMERGQLTIRYVWQLLGLVLTYLLAFVLGMSIWRSLGYQPVSTALIFEIFPVVIFRFLKLVPVGLFLLLGFAETPRERILAVPPLMILVAFIVLMELLSGYQGFGWPVLPLLLTTVWLSLVALAGFPLYVLGISLKDSQGPRPHPTG